MDLRRVLCVWVRARLWAIAVAAVAAVAGLSGCGSSSTSSRAQSGRSDAHWAALQNCLRTSAVLQQDTVSDTPQRIRMDDSIDQLVAGFTYERTFDRAEAQAKLHKQQGPPVPFRIRTSQWLGVSNVAYFFTGGASPTEVDHAVACLERTYPRAPRWPASVTLNSLRLPNSPYT